MDINELIQNPTFLIIAMLWEMAWKGFAMWKAAKADHKIMYVSILVFNTLGLLPISYLVYRKIVDSKTSNKNVDTGN